jgi:hypothetical protein
MEQIAYWNCGSCSSNEEIAHILWNPKIRCAVRKNTFGCVPARIWLELWAEWFMPAAVPTTNIFAFHLDTTFSKFWKHGSTKDGEMLCYIVKLKQKNIWGF